MASIQLQHSDLPKLRRIALGAQRLHVNAPFGRGVGAIRKAVEHLGYVQIDTISVVERAHHHVLRTRIPNYTPDMLNKALGKRDVYEYWAHAAAFLPMRDYRFSLPYKNLVKAGKVHWFKHRDEKLIKQIMQRIHSDGPLRSRDIEDNQSKAGGWWEWKPAKRALEQLYFQGDLMVTERQGFQKTYDLPERVIPATVDTSVPDYDEYADYMVNLQLQCHGFASLKGFTYLRRDPHLRKATKTLLNDYVGTGELVEFSVNDRGPFYTRAQNLDNNAPRLGNKVTILSPFDNIVIQRERLLDLFDFDYQIECYVPEAKRRFGYFCLPLLYRDAFVGRLDCKAHRKQGRLEVKSLHLDDHRFDPAELSRQLALALHEFARFQNCDYISVGNVLPNAFGKRLNSDLQSL